MPFKEKTMFHSTDKKRIKIELASIIQGAVTEYLGSIRGTAMLGKAEVMMVPGTTIVQVKCPTQQGPQFFEISIKASA